VTINPIVTWELRYCGTKDWLDELKAFHTARRGGVEKFYWTDLEKKKHVVRFVTDELAITEKVGHDENGILKVVAFETTVVIRKVWQ